MDKRLYESMNSYLIVLQISHFCLLFIFCSEPESDNSDSSDSDFEPEKEVLQGIKLTFFPGSHLAPKYFKVVANSKKLVAMTHTQNHFYPVAVLDGLNC